MINRILIRVKVVQILYSYLLSRSEFNIMQAPLNATRDRRFAYAVYLDMLYLIQELSGIRLNNPDRSLRAFNILPKLSTNRVGRALADNVELKAISFKNLSDLNLLDSVLPGIAAKIAESDYFQEYSRKRTRNLDDDVKLWTVMLESVVLKDPEFTRALRQNPDFSLTGLNNGIMMAVDTLRDFNDSRASFLKARQDLEKSLGKAYDLYFHMFGLILELTRQERQRIDAAKNKYLATADDLNPDTRFVDNRLAQFLEQNEQLQDYLKDHPDDWSNVPALMKSLGDAIRSSEVYQKYMAQATTDWKSDCEFWRDIFRSVILPSEALEEDLESKSVFWNDDLDIVGTFVLKTLRRFAQSVDGAKTSFLPQFKDDEDAQFGTRLLNYAVENRDTYREYIDKFISRDWDPERLAFMDIVIMTVALAEIINFPGIPIPVSFNEYIEIANNYSTRRSGPFINGILYSVVKMLSEEGLLHKPFSPAQK